MSVFQKRVSGLNKAISYERPANCLSLHCSKRLSGPCIHLFKKVRVRAYFHKVQYIILQCYVMEYKFIIQFNFATPLAELAANS